MLLYLYQQQQRQIHQHINKITPFSYSLKCAAKHISSESPLKAAMLYLCAGAKENWKVELFRTVALTARYLKSHTHLIFYKKSKANSSMCLIN
jgi:hypothetical protein